MTEISQKTDEELVKLALGDKQVFLHLMQRYENRLLVFIRRISGLTQEDAEDVLQDSFIKIYLNLNNFDPKLKFSSWAYRITRNEVISNFRKRKARPQMTFSDVSEDKLGKVTDGLELEKEVDKVLTKEKVLKILDKLDPKYKEILVLKFLEENSYKEISNILQKSTGTVGTLVNRAKKQFKKYV